jgi:hypothetical protein
MELGKDRTHGVADENDGDVGRFAGDHVADHVELGFDRSALRRG